MSPTQPLYKQSDVYPTDKPLVIDMLHSWADIPHESVAIWNLLYADGHVKPQHSPLAKEFVITFGALDTWPLFDQALDLLLNP